MNGIKSWPEGERPREKLLRQGASALSEAELLALLLGSGNGASNRSALDLGRALLSEFGALRGLADASCAEMQRVKGVGLAKAACIKAALELSNRFRGRQLESFTRFTSAAQVFEHLNCEFRDRRKEYFMALLLDGKNRIIKRTQISEGSLNQNNMYHFTPS
jgi:DNA repair protein RadC